MKGLKNLLFTIYSVFVVLVLVFLCILFTLSSQMKTEGAATMFGRCFMVMDTNTYQSRLPQGYLVISDIVAPSEIQLGDSVVYRYTDASQQSKVTGGKVIAIDAVASPASYMIGQDNEAYNEIAEESAILGVAKMKSLFLGGCFLFLMSNTGFYIGIILPVGILLISEVLLLTMILINQKKRAMPETGDGRKEDPFGAFDKEQKLERLSSTEPEGFHATQFNPQVVPADQVLPKKRPSLTAQNTVEPSKVEPPKPEPKPERKPGLTLEQKPEPKQEAPEPLAEYDQGEEMSSMLASLMKQEPSVDDSLSTYEEPKKEEQDDVKDLMQESSEDIINDILKKLYSEE